VIALGAVICRAEMLVGQAAGLYCISTETIAAGGVVKRSDDCRTWGGHMGSDALTKRIQAPNAKRLRRADVAKERPCAPKFADAPAKSGSAGFVDLLDDR